MSGDRVELHGLRALGRHGWFDHEQRDGQPFVVDATLTLDTASAAASDNLADTVDYGALGSAIVAVIEGEPVRLIETLAQRIADVCLSDSRVESVEVAVHKPQAPMAVPFADVCVRITGGRG